MRNHRPVTQPQNIPQGIPDIVPLRQRLKLHQHTVRIPQCHRILRIKDIQHFLPVVILRTRHNLQRNTLLLHCTAQLVHLSAHHTDRRTSLTGHIVGRGYHGSNTLTDSNLQHPERLFHAPGPVIHAGQYM